MASFGLREQRCVANVTVTWPDGTESSFDNVAAQQTLEIEQNGLMKRLGS